MSDQEIMEFLNSGVRPDMLQYYNNVLKPNGENRSVTQWFRDHLKASAKDAAQVAQWQQQRAQASTPSTSTPNFNDLVQSNTQSLQPPALPTPTLGGSYITEANAQAYLNANPQYAQEIINQGPGALNGRTPARWLVDHINENPGDPVAQRLTQFAQQNNLPVAAPTAALPSVPGGGNYNMNEAGSQAGSYQSVGATSQTQQGQQTQNVQETQTQQGTQTSQQQSQQNQTTAQQQTGQQQTTEQTAQQQQTAQQTAEQQAYNQQQASQQTTNQQQTGQQTTAQQYGQQQQSNQTTAQQQTGQQSTSGTSAQQQITTGTQTGQQVSTGQQTQSTQVTSPVDFTSLIQQQANQLGQSDAERSAYLTDFMNTGGTAFQSQVDQAIRNSMSGRAMGGAGESAKARVASYALSELARQNADQRLQAAQQLAGPTGLGTSVQTTAPLFGTTTTGSQTGQTLTTGTQTGTANTIGQTTGQTTSSQNTTGQTTDFGSLVGSSTGQTSNTQNTTGQTSTVGQTSGISNTTGQTTGQSSMTGQTTGQQTSAQNTTGQSATTGSQTGLQTTDLMSTLNRLANTVDFQSLVGNETQAGTATGSSASAGAGVVPQGQPIKTGGCVVCTAYVKLGRMHPGAVRAAVEWKRKEPKYSLAIDGYMLYGPFLARAVLKDGLFARLFRPIARAILYHECYLKSPNRLRRRWIALVLHEIFDHGSKPVGLLSRALGLATGVRCEKTKALLRSTNLSFLLP